MTMSELVEEAAKRGADKSLIASRLRHWVREGLIEPTGTHHPGTGRHRDFEDTALKTALALNALADFNLPVSVLRTASSALLKVLRHGEKESVPRFLAIGRKQSGKLSAYFRDNYGDALADSNGTIVLDLAKIWRGPVG
jgi:DNA-binding transcriptional MerR regulator